MSKIVVVLTIVALVVIGFVWAIVNAITDVPARLRRARRES